MLCFEKATKHDAERLAQVQTAAFDDESRIFRNIERGGPPGYDSTEWQVSIMECSQYFKIVLDGEIIGGIIVFAEKDGIYNLGRIFINPTYQNKGYGRNAMEYIEKQFSDAKKWWLGTPKWSIRNHYFYEKCGYVRVGEEGEDGYLYEKSRC